MSAVLKSDLVISVENYLAGEVISEVRHEYAGGEVYAMAGASNVQSPFPSKGKRLPGAGGPVICRP